MNNDTFLDAKVGDVLARKTHDRRVALNEGYKYADFFETVIVTWVRQDKHSGQTERLKVNGEGKMYDWNGRPAGEAKGYLAKMTPEEVEAHNAASCAALETYEALNRQEAEQRRLEKRAGLARMELMYSAALDAMTLVDTPHGPMWMVSTMMHIYNEDFSVTLMAVFSHETKDWNDNVEYEFTIFELRTDQRGRHRKYAGDVTVDENDPRAAFVRYMWRM